MFVVEGELGLGGRALWRDGYRHEAAGRLADAFEHAVELLDLALGIGGIRRAGLDAETGIGVDQCAGGEFFETRSVPGVILPMPVTARHEQVFLRRDKSTNLIAFVSKSLVGMANAYQAKLSMLLTATKN